MCIRDRLGASYRRFLGYLPQDFGFYPDFTAERFLLYMAALKALPSLEAKRKTAELLAMVGLEDSKNKKIKTFSGGMVRRLGIAQAMLNDPEILILDEPTAGLDPKERIRFRNIISSFSKDRIVILSTHIVSDVEYIADEILLMKKGRFLQQGSVENITKQVPVSYTHLDVYKRQRKESPARGWKKNGKKKISKMEHAGGDSGNCAVPLCSPFDFRQSVPRCV